MTATTRLPAHVHRTPPRPLASPDSPATIAARTLAAARVRGISTSRRQAAERIHNAGTRAVYDGAELRPFDQRAGAMQAFALPSLINGRRTWRGGRTEEPSA